MPAEGKLKMQADEARYLPQLIGGVAALLLGISGIVAVMAWAPISAGVADTVPTIDKLPTASAGAQTPPARTGGNAYTRVKCAECGIVVSTREIEQPGAGSAPGKPGGVMRVGLNDLPGKPTHSYEITVRMADGSSRVFVNANPGNWRPRERMIIIEGTSQPDD